MQNELFKLAKNSNLDLFFLSQNKIPIRFFRDIVPLKLSMGKV